MTTAIAYGPLADEMKAALDAAAAALPRNLCTVPLDNYGAALIGVIDLAYSANDVNYVEFRLVGRQPSGYAPNETLHIPASSVIAGGTPR